MARPRQSPGSGQDCDGVTRFPQSGPLATRRAEPGSHRTGAQRLSCRGRPPGPPWFPPGAVIVFLFGFRPPLFFPRVLSPSASLSAHASRLPALSLETLRAIGRQVRRGVRPLLDGIRVGAGRGSRAKSLPRRRSRINLSPTPDQRRLLTNAAQRVGLPLTTFVLESALAAVKEGRVVPPATDQALSGLRVELRRIGVNLNQLVARCNRLQRVRFGDLAQASATLQALEAKVLALVEGHGREERAGVAGTRQDGVQGDRSGDSAVKVRAKAVHGDQEPLP